MKRELIVITCTALLILLFGYNSLDKLKAGAAFAAELNNQPLPNSWTPYLHYGIPAVNLLILALLLFPRTNRLGFTAAIVWLAIFTAYIAVVLLHAFQYIPCSCAGVIKGMSWTQHLFFNLFFILTATVALFLTRQPRTHTTRNFTLQNK